MAYQPDVKLQFKSCLGRDQNGNEVFDVYEKTVAVVSPMHTGHEHCGTCGACFTGGMQLIHRCPEPIRQDILEIMCDEMRSTDEKTRIMNRTHDAR